MIKRKPGRPPGKTLPRQINVYVTPGTVDQIKGLLNAGETMSGMIRAAIEKELREREVRPLQKKRGCA